MKILEGKKLKSNVICQFQNGWKRIKTLLIKSFTKLIEITQKKIPMENTKVAPVYAH